MQSQLNNPLAELDTSAVSQRQRLLARLRQKSITTLEARKELDILMPAARIYELRHDEGYNIKLHWVDEYTDAGISHTVGRYVLHPGKFQSKRGKYHVN